MAVRSRRFLSSSSIPNGATGIEFVVPVDRTAIIKCLTAHATSATASSIRLEISTAGGSVRTVADLPMAGNSSVIERDLFIVATENETIRLRRGAGTVSATLSGALLDGDPS